METTEDTAKKGAAEASPKRAKKATAKPARKSKDRKKVQAKGRQRKSSSSSDEGPMPGKKLLQSWVDEDYHEAFSKIAQENALRPATYLRQLVHGHVDAKRAAAREMKS